MIQPLRLLFLYLLLLYERLLWRATWLWIDHRKPRHPTARFLPEIGDGISGRVVQLRPRVRVPGSRRRA